uniref:Uncharacterized protein n=1 Tax=Myoviridae sp. ctncN39 TaxID=2825170 RepID=A0A8S5V292_9CAUD|nr:MAG TPA: hypothetical protein [Myoviridae sp. ctncN39]
MPEPARFNRNRMQAGVACLAALYGVITSRRKGG